MAEPLGLGKVMGVAAACGAEVLYSMAVGQTVDEMMGPLEEFDPDVLAFSLMTCQLPVAEEMSRRLRERRKDLVVLAGGHHPSAMQRLSPPFDAFVVGEGEIPMEHLVTSLCEGRDWRNGPGIMTASRAGVVLPGRIEDIDAFPPALRVEASLRDKCVGLVFPPPTRQTGFAYVEYARGCQWNCSFCCKRVIWPNRQMVFRDPKCVVEEMLRLQTEHQVNLFFFADLNLTVSAERLLLLCAELRRRGFTGSWFCMSNIASAYGRRDLLEAMADAGCTKIMYGVESVSDDSLRRVGKGSSYEQEMSVLADTLDVGVIPHIFYMLGFPWETLSSIEVNFARLVELPGLQLRLAIATPLPGSRWYEDERPRLVIDDLARYDCEHLVYRHPSLREEDLRAAVSSMYRAFYESPNYQARAMRFLAAHPRYEAAFTEFAELLRDTVAPGFRLN